MADKKIKILFFCGGSYVYGKERSMLGIMNGLKNKGYSIYNISNGWNDGHFNNLLRQAGIEFCEIKLGKISKSLNLKYIIWTLDALFHLPIALYNINKVFKKINPEIIFFDSTYTAFWSSLVIPIKTLKIIRVAEKPNKNYYFKYLLSKEKKIEFIGISKFICDDLLKAGVNKTKITLIHNGFTIIRKYKCSNLTNNILQIGCAGQISPHKGQDVLIRALGEIKKKGISFKCYIAGTGEIDYIKKLILLSKDLNIEKNIIWLGYQEDMNSFYKRIKICIVPSIFEEPFGRVAVEAGLNCVPSIVTNKGGLPEVVKDGITGFVIPSNDSSLIAEKISYFYNNRDKIILFGQQARDEYIKQFSITIQINNITNLISRILNSDG